MKLNQGCIPPQGFHFPVEAGVVLKAPTYAALLKEIETWRTQNGQPVGDVAADVDRYFCGRWPHFCLPERHETAPAGLNITRAVNAWAAIKLRETPRGGYRLVNQDVAERRCTACRACPFNKPWKGQCGNCAQATESILIRIRQLRKIALDDQLLGCSILQHDNKTAIHLPISALALTSEQTASLPQNCWIPQATD